MPATPITIPNAGFETPVLGPPGYAYAPAGSSWSWPVTSGIIQGSIFGAGPAAEGIQGAFLQQTGSFSQALSGFVAGQLYHLTFKVSQQIPGQTNHDFNVLIDSTLLGHVTPASSNFEQITLSFTAGAPTHTLVFQGVNTLGASVSSILDEVAITPVGGAPSVPPIDPAKVAILAALPAPICVEIASVGWFGGQQWIHYSDAPWDWHYPALSAYGLTGIQARFTPDKWRASFTRTSDLSDDTMDLEFNDLDWNITSLWWGYGGEGVPVIITQYFPGVDLLIEIFDGYLRTPKEADGFTFPVECAAGFRSPNLTIPRRIIYSGCSALFGGLINQTTGQPWFPTQDSINKNDCPYSVHLGPPQLVNPQASGFGKVDPGTGLAYTDCPRRNPGDCVARLNDSKSYLGFDVIVGSEVVGSGTRHPFMAYIRANETALKIPLRVIYGEQRVQDLTLLAYESGSNPGENASNGFLTTLWVIAEGPNVGLGPALSNPNDADAIVIGPSTPGLPSSIIVNEQPIDCGHVNFSGVFGVKRQGKALVHQAGLTAQQLNYSGTSIVNLDYGKGDFRQFTPDSIKASCHMVSNKGVRVYSKPPTPTSYTRKYTTNRAWCLLDLLTNKRYGLGVDHSRFVLSEWTALADWCDESVPGVDELGSPILITRSTFNGVVDARTAQQTLGDFCMMGRFTPPFQDQGKLRVLPMREDEVPADFSAFKGPIIADYDNDMLPGVRQNILWDGGKSTLMYSIKNDSEVPNEIKFTFNDHNYDDTERPLVFQDLQAQLLAGRAAGDLSFRVVSKSYAGMGINNLSEAARIGTMLLYYGENDAGGLKNNFTVKFQTWSVLAKLLGLHPWQVIRVLSQRVNRFTERGTLEWEPYASDAFQFFRITKMTRTDKLVLEIEAQLYAHSSLAQFKALPAAPGVDNPDGQTTNNPGPNPEPGETKNPIPPHPQKPSDPVAGAGILLKVN